MEPLEEIRDDIKVISKLLELHFNKVVPNSNIPPIISFKEAAQEVYNISKDTMKADTANTKSIETYLEDFAERIASHTKISIQGQGRQAIKLGDVINGEELLRIGYAIHNKILEEIDKLQEVDPVLLSLMADALGKNLIKIFNNYKINIPIQEQVKRDKKLLVYQVTELARDVLKKIEMYVPQVNNMVDNDKVKIISAVVETIQDFYKELIEESN